MGEGDVYVENYVEAFEKVDENVYLEIWYLVVSGIVLVLEFGIFFEE